MDQNQDEQAPEDFKLHVIIRTDLGMTKGKICSQSAHAVLGLYKDLMENDPVLFAQWASLEFPQETYEAKSMQDLYNTAQQAKALGLQAYIVHDAGRTQIAPMSPTVCAIGPCSYEFVKSILENYKLLQ